MIHPSATDLIELLKQIVKMLQPYAQSHGIELRFESKEKRFVLLFRPDLVIHDLTNLICNIISYTPHENTITIITDKKTGEFKITIVNTGINLSPVTEITRSCLHQVSVKGDKENKQTWFSFTLPVTIEKEKENNNKPVEPVNKKIIPDYYNEIRNRLRSHFSKADTLVAQLSILYPKEAAFLQKINAVIVANMENEFFDSSVLSREMNMSRTQLFRRLKPLIQQPPAKYIKSIRLQKAKELLETTDTTVGDAAFKTGFQTQSHFTKAFIESFGFRPSAIKRKNGHATNE
jgi:AraC-like DNA-binding protein